MKKRMCAKVFLLFVITLCRDCIFANIDFANFDSNITIRSANSLVCLKKAANITGWQQMSIVKSFGNNASTNWSDGYSGAAATLVAQSGGTVVPPTQLLVSDSNLVNYLAQNIVTSLALRTNSNALVSVSNRLRTTSNYLSMQIRTNSNQMVLSQRTTSNALVYGLRVNSNAIVYLGGNTPTSNLMRTTSNALLYGLRVNSNAIVYLGNNTPTSSLMRTTSNAVVLTRNLLRTTSNYHAMQIRTSSNLLISLNQGMSTAFIWLNDLDQLAKGNSNAIVSTKQQLVPLQAEADFTYDLATRGNSNAIVSMNQQLGSLQQEADFTYDLATRGNSNAIVSMNQQLGALQSEADFTYGLAVGNSNVIVVWKRTSSNALLYGLRTNSNALVRTTNVLRTTSNYHAIQIRTSSNLLVRTTNVLRTTSNYHAVQIRTNSNAMVLWRRTDSNAIVTMNQQLGSLQAEADFTYGLAISNSNAIVYNDQKVVSLQAEADFTYGLAINNSNAIVYNDQKVVSLQAEADFTYGLAIGNSNAVVRQQNSIDNIYTILNEIPAAQQTIAIIANSNAIVLLAAQMAALDPVNQVVSIRTTSNALVYGLRVSSNAILYQSKQIRTNSNAFMLTRNVLRTTSNHHTMQIRTNSNAMVLWRRTDSNALVRTTNVLRTMSNYHAMQIRTNSNQMILWQRTSSSALLYGLRTNSNAIMLLDQNFGLLKTEADFTYDLATRGNSNAIVLLDQNYVLLKTEADFTYGVAVGNSNVMVQWQRTDSNALLSVKNMCRTTSNYHAMQIRTNSNEMIFWQRTTSNAVSYQGVRIRNDSNTLVQTKNCLRTTSNYHALQIRTSSNAINYLSSSLNNGLVGAFTWLDNLDSLAIGNSNAIVSMNQQLGPLQTEADYTYDLATGNSNAIVAINQTLVPLQSEADYTYNLATDNYNSISTLSTSVFNNTVAINRQTTLLRTVSNSVLALISESVLSAIKANSDAIIKIGEVLECVDTAVGDLTIPDPSYTMYFDISLSVDHIMIFSQSCLFNGNGHAINFARMGSGMLVIPPGVQVTMSNVVLRGYSPSFVTLGAGSSLIFGGGTTIELLSDQDLVTTLTFQGSCIVQGNAHRCNLATGGIMVGHASELLWDNITLDGLAGSNIACLDSTGTVSYQNVTLNLDTNVTFTSGYLGFCGNVLTQGNGMFTLASQQPSVIATDSMLFLDRGITLGYTPPTANKKLFQMQDATSVLFLSGASVSCSTTGMQLTKGTLVVDGIVPLYNNGGKSVSQGFILGDGIAANDLAVDLMPAAQLALQSGSLVYANVH